MTPEEEAEEEDRAWNELGLAEFFRGYAESDSIYDDPIELPSAESSKE